MAGATTFQLEGTLLLVALTTAGAVDAETRGRGSRADGGPLVVTADQAKQLHERLQALRADDGCVLEHLRTERHWVNAVWESPDQGRAEVRLTPITSTDAATPELQFRLEATAAAQESCPSSLRAADALLRAESFGRLSRASDPLPSSPPEPTKAAAPRNWQTRLDGVRERLAAPSPARLALDVTLLRTGWGVALGLSALALVATRRALRKHWHRLGGLALIALCFRVLLADFHLADERLPYLTQATCIAYPDARSAYNLCSRDLFGDVHQLGVASLFSWGFSLVGGLAEVAGSMILALGVANALLVYALSRRAFGPGPAPLLAGLLYAVHPWAIHFAGATQTEIPNDSFLLLGTLLVVWDVQRRAAMPRTLAARVATSPVFRGFFVAMATATRPEQLAWLPVMVAVWWWFERPRWQAAMRATVLVTSSGLFLVPTLGALWSKASGLHPLGEVPSRLWAHLSDVDLFLLGPLAGLALLASWVALVRRGAPALGRVLALLVLVWLALFALGASWVRLASPHQAHIVYHGSVLFWPVLAFGLTRMATVLGGWLPILARGDIPTLLQVVGTAAMLVSFNACAATPLRGLPLLDLQADRHRKLVEALPPRVVVITVGHVYADAPVAAVLFDRGGDTGFYDAAGSDPARPAQPDCRELRHTVSAGRAANRPVVLIHDPHREFGPRSLAAPDLVRGCGLVVNEVQSVEGFRLFSVDADPATAATPDGG